MKIQWTEEAWEDYILWQSQDRKTLKKINTLLKDIKRNGHEGIGKSEPLLGNLSGWWSRIDSTNRIVYQIDEDNDIVIIAQCKGHY